MKSPYPRSRTIDDCIAIAESMEPNLPTPHSALRTPHFHIMGCIKHYVGNLVCQCSDERFGQEAVETAIFNGRVPLTYNLEQDLATIMGPSPLVAPELPAKAERLYDLLVEEYQAECRRNLAALTPSNAPLLEQIAA